MTAPIEKNIKSRIQHKHDTEANWQKAENFVPLIGEIIVYDPDTINENSRIKIGDGITKGWKGCNAPAEDPDLCSS